MIKSLIKMPPLTDQESKRLIRYHGQSLRLLQDAIDQIRQGRWLRCEDLLWGSLTLAVKGVALSRGDQLADQQALREYAEKLGQERRNRRIRDAFTKLASFADTADTAEQVGGSRRRSDNLVAVLEDVSGAVERLWEMLPTGETDETSDDPLDDSLEAWLERYGNLPDGDRHER
jgi:hypothetical protein